jgi:hypothetical protein
MLTLHVYSVHSADVGSHERYKSSSNTMWNRYESSSNTMWNLTPMLVSLTTFAVYAAIGKQIYAAYGIKALIV